MSNVPSSGSNLCEMDPGAQASMPGTEGALPQATSIAQCRPRRAAAAASTIQQHGAPRRNRVGTSATSTMAQKSTDHDPNTVLYGPDGVTVWEPRPLPKIVLDLMKPAPKPVPPEISIRIQPLTVVVDAASSNSHNKVTKKGAGATSTTDVEKSQTPVVVITETEAATGNEVLAHATSTGQEEMAESDSTKHYKKNNPLSILQPNQWLM